MPLKSSGDSTPTNTSFNVIGSWPSVPYSGSTKGEEIPEVKKESLLTQSSKKLENCFLYHF